jgi:glycosyltransferase involved in cell wall biosynthesis
VKLLEAFASGISSVSTPLGAEGLATVNGEVCELASNAQEFASAVLKLLSDREYAAALARRARRVVETERDAAVITRRLEQTYRHEVLRLRGASSAAALDKAPVHAPVPHASGPNKSPLL